jgi:2-oxo-3-hexenedioate decarboxylase/2-keto-4-pentenoate hydratase
MPPRRALRRHLHQPRSGGLATARAPLALMLPNRPGGRLQISPRRACRPCAASTRISGVVLAQRVRTSGATLRRSAYARLGLEFEIAMRIGRDTPGGEHTAHSVRARTWTPCAPTRDRGRPPRRLQESRRLRGLVVTTRGTGMVLSALAHPLARPGPVRERGVRQRPGGGPRLRPRVLGDPFVALAWLANHLAARGPNAAPARW